MNDLFYWCVRLLIDWANALGMTYEEINIWIFVIIEPIIFLAMLTTILTQGLMLRKVTKQ